MEFTPAPSDADDSVTVWFAQLGLAVNNLVWPVLFNVFAIRGEEYRDPRVLLTGLDHLNALGARHLVGAHGPPLSGADEIKAVVTDYRDAIQFLWDQTVRGMNKGLSADELTQFVKDFRFERMGVFPYSFEPTTSSAKLDGHLPDEVKTARVDALMTAQQQVAFGWADAQVGKTLEALMDGPDPEFANHVRGRTHADAPDIDCAIRVKGKNLRPGDIVQVKVTAADGYDLVGRSVGQAR